MQFLVYCMFFILELDMDNQEYGLAKELARNCRDLNNVIQRFVDRLVVVEMMTRRADLGVRFSRTENGSYAATAELHRRIIDIEFENAIYEDKDCFEKSLIARVKLFLRHGGGERSQLACPIFMFSTGHIHLLNGVVVDINDTFTSQNDASLIGYDLSELIVKSIHPTLHVYTGKEDFY